MRLLGRLYKRLLRWRRCFLRRRPAQRGCLGLLRRLGQARLLLLLLCLLLHLLRRLVGRFALIGLERQPRQQGPRLAGPKQRLHGRPKAAWPAAAR
jgi:hypothetical protein